MTAPSKERADSHWRILLPSTYICPPDLRGQDVTLTIKQIKVGDLPLEGTSQTERKMLIWFEQASKPWAPSKTALREIEMTLGTGITADWIGKDITLFPTRKELTGRRKGKPIKDPGTKKITEGIRVRVRRKSDDADDETEEQTGGDADSKEQNA